MFEEKLNEFNAVFSVLEILFHPGLLTIGGALLLYLGVNKLKEDRVANKGPLTVVQVLIVIGAIGFIGWKIHNVIAPTPQEPVHKRQVLLDDEGKRWW